ncbi:MAG: type IV-A pilus assembly ATPase PilB [Gammaproteobacteria bacterium]|nr:type IV-A pilus assembly ATPase PilB [Gammaproteobacteria bacterium]
MSIALNGLPKRLVDKGLLTEVVAQRAYFQANSEGMSFVSYLMEHHIVESRAIASAASVEFGIPLFDIQVFEVDPDVIKLIDQRLMQELNALPLAKRGSRLYVAISDPGNLHALDQLQFHTGLTVEPVLTEAMTLSKAIEKAQESADTTLAEFSDSTLDDLEFTGLDDEARIESGDSDIDEAPIVRFVNKILMEAIQKGASDVHFEPYEGRFRVRIRIDGMMKEIATPPANLGNRICARLKVMARLDIAERRLPQDGRMKLKLSKNRGIDFRVSTCPILFGEKIVLRILDSGSLKFGADSLGMVDEQKKTFIKAIQRPHGMVLITGPTGSGKTVSLYSALSILNTNDRNISTAEDPAEIYLPGVNQVNVNNKIGLTFATALRAFLRQDPDVIMVGEIRDTETAEIAMKAAQTGHMVLSTLHTNSAPDTIIRLTNMGVEPYNIVASISLIIAQRLVRKLCTHCKQPIDLEDEVMLHQGFKAEDLGSFGLFGPNVDGCEYCHAGYRDRLGIFEVMPLTDKISRIVIRGGSSAEIAEQEEEDGILSLRRAGLEKVKAGLTSIEEINRVTSE